MSENQDAAADQTAEQNTEQEKQRRARNVAPGGRSPDGEGAQVTQEESLLEPSQLKAHPQPHTAVDAMGVERIVTPHVDAWEPAPVEPSELDVRRAEERQRVFAEQREGRINALTDTDRVGETAKPATDALAAERG